MQCYCQNKPGNWLSKVNPGIGFVHIFEELMDNLLGKRLRVLDRRGTFVFLRFSLSWPEMGFRAAREPGVQEAGDGGTWCPWWQWWWEGLRLWPGFSWDYRVQGWGKEKVRAVRVWLRRQAVCWKVTRLPRSLSCPVIQGTHPGSSLRPEWQSGGACVLNRVWLCDTTDCSPPGSSVQGILQARILQWDAICSSSGSSWPRGWACVFYTAGGFFPAGPPGCSKESDGGWGLRSPKASASPQWQRQTLYIPPGETSFTSNRLWWPYLGGFLTRAGRYLCFLFLCRSQPPGL